MNRSARMRLAPATAKRPAVAAHAPVSSAIAGSEGALERHAESLARASRDTLRLPLTRSVAEDSPTDARLPPVLGLAAARGYDLGSIRIHTDAQAAAVADQLQARALTAGRDIYFARGQYQPHSAVGRELIAHEFTHAVQQSFDSVGARIQCACRPLRPPFDLAASRVGEQIRNAVAGVTIEVPGPTPESPATRVPRVNPGQVIALLATSPCFLRDAAAVNRVYCSGASGCEPGLAFDFHADEEKGSEFVPGAPATLRVEVTSLPHAIRHIVHEIGHAVPTGRRATWPAPITRGWGARGGTVTRAVRAGLQEESRTRTRENEVMQEIQSSPLWRRLLGSTRVPVQLTRPQEVRDSFVSGLPRLTYQEFFIIDAMKRRYRAALRGMSDERVRRAARGVLAEGFASPRRAQVASYTTSVQTLAHHRTRLQPPEPAAPPSLAAAGECIEIYNRHRRNLKQANADLAERDRQCPAFIVFHQRALQIPFSVQDDAGRRRVYEMWNTMRIRHQERLSERRAANALISWYDEWQRGLGERERGNRQLQRSVLRYFSWVLIAEAMSREWSGHQSVDRDIQRGHLELLIAAGGERRVGTLTGARGLLSGITRPPRGGTP